MLNTNFEIIPTNKGLGADIVGLDLSKELSESTIDKIIQHWHEHLVLRFRNQQLTNDNLVQFSRYFGELDLAPITSSGETEIPEHPELLVVSNVKINGKAIGSLGSYEAVWHTDMSYLEMPPKMTCLYALEIPEGQGNTSFLNMYSAYEGLPVDMKEKISHLRCKHDFTRNSAGEVRKGFEEYAEEKDPRKIPGALHPLVYSHPETKIKSLYLGRRSNSHITDLPLEESESLLNYLWEQATKAEYQWTHEWQVGDVVLWDNRATMHRRDAFSEDSRRVLHRTQVQGEHRPE